MYSEHFGFRCLPFEDRADTQFTYLTPDLEEALASLEFEVRFGKGVALVLGDAGTGKTQLLRTLLLRLHSTEHAVVVSASPTPDFDPIREACKGFGVTLPSSGGHLARRMARLRRHLSRSAEAGHRSILVLDQGENLTASGLSQVATLSELQDERGRILCVFLFGQPRLLKALEEPEFARLRQQFTGERILRPFNEAQTCHYLRHRLRVAGAGDPDLIDEEAARLIHASSNGIPRLINHFANEALITAYAAGATGVTGAMVEDVIGATESKARSARLSDLGLKTPRIGSGGGHGGQPTPSQYRPIAQSEDAVRSRASLRTVETMNREWETEHREQAILGTPTAFEGPGIIACAAAPASVTTSLESLFAQGSALLERLERVLSKAERTCSMTDASLSQHTAVERHLTTLSAGAERVLESLSSAMDQAQQTLSDAPRRLDETLIGTEQRLVQLDGKLAALTQIEENTDRRSARLDAAQRQVDAAETRAQSVLRELTTHAEIASQRCNRLTEGLRAAARLQPDVDRVIARLGDRAKESEGQATAIEERQRRSAERSRELRTELEALDAKATTVLEGTSKDLDRLVRGVQERVQAQVEDLQRDAVEGVRGTLETLSRKREDVSGLLLELEASVRTLRTRSAEAVGQAEADLQPIVEKTLARFRGQLHEQATTFQRMQDERMAAALVEHRSRVEELLTSTQRRVDETCQGIEGVERRQRLVENAAIPLAEKVSNAAIAVSGLTEKAGGLSETASALGETIVAMQETVHVAATQVESLSARATSLDEALSENVKQAREVLHETETARREAETIQQAVSASIREITQSSERVDGLREQAAASQQTVERLARDLAIGQTVAAELSTATESASDIKRALHGLTREAAERVGQLDSHNAAACRVRNELADVNTVAHSTLQRIHADHRSLEGIVTEARSLAERVSATQSEGDAIAARLDERIAIAESLYRRAEEVAAGVEGRANELEVACQKADGLSQRLSETSRDASEIVTRAEKTVTDAETTAADTSSNVDRLLKEVWSLTGKTEGTAKLLETANARAEDLIGKLTHVAGPADAAAGKLAQNLEEADRQYQRIARDSKEAQKLAERVASVTQVLASAREAETSIQQTTADVQSLQDRFASLVTQAAQQSVSLRELLASVQTMTVEQERAHSEGETVLRRIEDHRATTQAATQAGEELLREFLGQAESLERELKELGAKIGEIEGSVRSAVERRDETVGQAKAQTVQLERVGEAVRKVFAAVSQATLEARERAKELTAVNRASAEKLGVFTAETQRAADTLNEWVREAVRAQERLERTLRSTPAIQQTHPREALLGLARAATSSPDTTALPDTTVLTTAAAQPRATITRSRTATVLPRSTDTGELKTLVAPDTTASPDKSAPVERLPNRAGRAGEIAQLIEDAKKATAEAR